MAAKPPGRVRSGVTARDAVRKGVVRSGPRPFASATRGSARRESADDNLTLFGIYSASRRRPVRRWSAAGFGSSEETLGATRAAERWSRSAVPTAA